MYLWLKINGVLLLCGIIDAASLHRRQSVNDNEEEGLSNDNYDTSRYKFAYGVEDHKTGDFKMHQEERDGDGVVKGEYTVADADGSLRTVRYTADQKHGFHAVITKAGDARQEFIPPLPTPQPLLQQQQQQQQQSYLRQVYIRPTTTPSPSNHYALHQHNGRSEGVRYTNTPYGIHNSGVKKYIEQLPQFAKHYAAKQRMNIAAQQQYLEEEDAAHYQSIAIDNDRSPATHYSYRVTQAEKERIEQQQQHKAKQQQQPQQQQPLIDVYANRPAVVFQMQTPQGFRKATASDADTTTTTSPNNYDVEEPANDNEEGYNWRQAATKASPTPPPVNNYRNVFETNFGKLRRPQEGLGAYSYMNFEGESNNGYELQHNQQQQQQNILRKKSNF